MAWKLHTENIGGNLHEAATWINKQGWAQYVIALDCAGLSTVAVFCMPADLVHKIRAETPSYRADPRHDDPIKPTRRTQA